MNLATLPPNAIIGRNVSIGEGCIFANFNGDTMEYLSIGDCTRFFEFVKVLVPRLSVGDYCKIHNRVLIMGNKDCTIGHNCWIGQNTVLNSHARLDIRNNVSIGMSSYIWTHAAAGELLEGCQIYNMKPVTIEEDCWLIGNVVISPGVTLARGTVVLPGSVVTKNTRPRSCYAGVPAVDISNKMQAWRDVSLDEKYKMMKDFISEFVKQRGGTLLGPDAYTCELGTIIFREKIEEKALMELKPNTTVITKDEVLKSRPKGVSVFTLSTKQYTKTLSPLEIELMKFLVGTMARFIPE